MTIPGTIRKETVVKLTAFLKDFSEKYSNKEYNIYKAIKEFKVSSLVIKAMLNLNISEKLGSGQYICKVKEIEPILGRKVAVECNKLAQKYDEPKTKLPENPLAKYSNEELFEELKARGFYGELYKAVLTTTKL